MLVNPIVEPAHYLISGIQPIEVIEAWRLGFHLGNVIKYVARADHKGTSVDDLKKASWYLAREIRRREGKTK